VAPEHTLPVTPGRPTPDVIAPPNLPSSREEILKCDVASLMKSIVSWRRVALPERFLTDKAFTQRRVETKFWKERPLQLKAPDTEYASVGFKAPWTKAQCKTAIEHRQRYEAAINIDWLKAFSAEEGDRVISGDRITYDDIENVRISLMVMDPNALASAQRRQGLDLLFMVGCRRSQRRDDRLRQRRLPQARTDISGRACGPSLVAGGRDEVEQEGLRSVLPIR
jgi:hypothetical protein